MKLTAENQTETTETNYVIKKVTFVPEKGKLITYKQIRKYCEDFQKKLPKGNKMTVTGLNIERETTFQGYEGKFRTDEEQDDYLGRISKDPNKFNAFFNFTITVRESTIENDDVYDEE